jgi:hypothetical protein
MYIAEKYTKNSIRKEDLLVHVPVVNDYSFPRYNGGHKNIKSPPWTQDNSYHLLLKET